MHLLETTQVGVDQIAADVGYAGGVTLRSLLRRKLGRGARPATEQIPPSALSNSPSS